MDFNYQYMQYNSNIENEKENKDKYATFKERICKFENIDSIEEARELAKQIMPTANEINRFNIGNAKCVIVNSGNMFRITLDSAEECICYDFSPNTDLI